MLCCMTVNAGNKFMKEIIMSLIVYNFLIFNIYNDYRFYLNLDQILKFVVC